MKMRPRELLGLVFAVATVTACGAPAQRLPPSVEPFTLNIVTSSSSPLPLVYGQAATVSITASQSYYLTTWSVQAVYVSPSAPSALCAVAVPSPPTASAFPFSITTATTVTSAGFVTSYPCTQQIEFDAYPQPAVGSTASPSPQWTAMLWVTVQPPIAPFTLNLTTTQTSPLTLIVGQTGAVDVTAANPLYLTTWSVQAVYISPTPPALCAVAVPSAPSSGAFPYSITTASTAGPGFAASYPCMQQIEFEASPSTASSAPQWSSMFWVQVEPSP
jgi:hypothetical protein